VKHIPCSFVIELVKESEVRTATKGVCGLKRLTQLRSSRPSRYVAVSCLSQLEISFHSVFRLMQVVHLRGSFEVSRTSDIVQRELEQLLKQVSF